MTVLFGYQRAHIVGLGEFPEERHEVQKLSVSRIVKPRFDRDGVLRMEEVRSGRVVDDTCPRERAT